MEPKKGDDESFSFDGSMSKISYGHKTAEDVQQSSIKEFLPSIAEILATFKGERIDI